MPPVFTRVFRAISSYAPTKRFAALVAACAPVWLFSGTPQGNAIVAGVVATLLLLWIVDAVRIPSKSALVLTRTTPDVIGLGDTESGTYHIQSHYSRKIRATLDHLPPSALDAPLAGDAPASGALTIPPDGEATLSFPITTRTRGVFSIGPTAVTITGALGLVTKTAIYDLSDTIKIIPSIAGSRRYRLLTLQRQMRNAGQRALRFRGHGTSFSNLREYVIGDDPRHIDWKASARQQRLISREYTIEQGQNVMLVVDAGRMMTQLSGTHARFEHALSSALILADVALAAGDRVGLVVFNERVRHYLAPARGSQILTQIRDALLDTTATMSEPDYAAAFRTIAERQRRRSLVVLFTDVIDVRSSRAVLANTARTALRHLPLVVALRNDELADAAIPAAVGDDMTAYRNVAAEELLSARNDALQHMRQSGVMVMDVSPTAMTTAVINQYLEIKDRALL